MSIAGTKRPRRQSNQPLPPRLRTLFHSDISATSSLPKKLELIHSNPNIYLVRDFLSSSELLYFDKVCTQHGKAFKSSFTENEEQQEVVSEERTSSHIHLSKGQHSLVRTVETRASDIVGLHSQSVEPLQIVSYRNGQHFNTHHDAGTLLEDGTIELVYPKRLVTFFVYLNNLPPHQGHTAFPDLNLSVQPQRGCAVLFCNLLPDGSPDHRTIHCARPVTRNLRKYGINIWLCDCNMQELSQVKANCAVSGDSSSFDTATSALTRAEELTRKYITNHSNSTSSSSSSPTAVFENTGSDGYWGSPTKVMPGKAQLLDDHRPLPVSGCADKQTRKEKTKTEEKISPAETAAGTGGGGWGRYELYFDDTVVYLGPSNNSSTSSNNSNCSSSNRSREV